MAARRIATIPKTRGMEKSCAVSSVPKLWSVLARVTKMPVAEEIRRAGS